MHSRRLAVSSVGSAARDKVYIASTLRKEAEEDDKVRETGIDLSSDAAEIERKPPSTSLHSSASLFCQDGFDLELLPEII